MNQISELNRPQTRPLDGAQEDPSIARISAIAIPNLSVVATSTQFSSLISKELEETNFIKELNEWADTQKLSSLTNIEIAKERILTCYQDKTDFLMLSDLGLSSLPYCLFKKLTNLKILYLRDNQLTSFDGTGLSNLKKLYLTNNQLTSFDGTGLSNLTELYLTNNQLTSFDGTGLSNLTNLNLHTNQLTSFDGTGLSKLTELNLHTNQLSSFDGTGLSNLTNLNLHTNQLSSFDGTGLSNLTELNLHTNYLKTFDGTGLSNLTNLNLHTNQLTSFVGTELIKLKELYLTNNQFTLFDGTGLSNLKKLYLTKNLLESFDGTGLSNLTVLNLNNNDLKSFDGTGLTNLKDLHLDNNHLSSFVATGLTNLALLCLDNNHLSSFDGTELSNLIVLYLNKNQLTSFVGTGLSNLTKLYLEKNQLTSFKGTGLTNLTNLYLDTNQLTSFDGTGLTNLTDLELDNNHLTSFEGTGLDNLKNLYLDNNRLTSFDGTGLSNLIDLQLDNNQLTSLIGIEFPNLSFFSIKNNPITELPMTLSRCPQLTYLSVEGTLIAQTITQAILASCQALRSEAAQINLILKIQLWLRYSELNIDFNFIQNFDPKQKATIYDWLIRLESAADFRNNQKKLAEIVCLILKDLQNSPFQELALTQMEVNNECCQDRAAMALNELYLSWQVCFNCENLTDKEKLKLIIQAGKTLALRNAIGMQLRGLSQKESVETYLYYESTLAKQLNLLTCIKDMSYPRCAQKLNIEALTSFVEKNYLEQAAALPILDTLIVKDSQTKNDIGLIKSRSQLFLDQLGNMPEKQEKETDDVFKDRELQWLVKAGDIKTEREKKILQLKIQFLKKTLGIA